MQTKDVVEDRGEQLSLTEDEVAFYDALETNDSAVAVLGDETLRAIAQELAATVRRNALTPPPSRARPAAPVRARRR